MNILVNWLRLIPACDGRSRTILRVVPNSQDRHRRSAADAVDNDVGRHRDQFACVGMTAGPASARKRRQTIAREKRFSSNSPGGHWIIDRDIANDPADISQRPGAPNDGQRSERLWWRRVEFPIGDA